MNILIIESIITGIIFLLLGVILFNKNNNKPCIPGISSAFFMTGVIFYIFGELSEFKILISNIQ